MGSMKKVRKFLISIFFIAFLAVGITFAYAASQQNTATNVVTVGKVSIELINIDDASVASGRSIAAGEAVSKIVKVKNTGSYPAYVRMKVKKEWVSASEGFDTSKLSKDAIVADCMSDWVEGTKDTENTEDSGYTYYYYQNVLAAGDTVDFMNTYHVDGSKVSVLADYHKSSISISGQISVQAEAVQADYFDDQLERNNSGKIIDWNEITFKDFEEDATIPDTATAAAVSGTAVNFVGKADEFVSFENEKGNTDLFLMTKGMLPGQEAKQEVNIKNTSNDEMEVFLHAKLPEGISEEERNLYIDLLQHLKLHVESEKGGVLFDGTLLGQVTKDDGTVSEGDQISLGVFKTGQGDKLTISITLSPSWKKASCQTKVLWVFSTQKKSTTPSNGGGGGSQPITTPVVTDAPTPTIEPTISVTATPEPTAEVTKEPIVTLSPTKEPVATEVPTKEPVVTLSPTEVPTEVPTETPVALPGSTKEPMVLPGQTEDVKPTDSPTATPKPTKKPTTKPRVTSTPQGIGPYSPPEDVPTLSPAPTGSKVVHEEEPPEPSVPVERPTKTGDSTPIIFWMVMGTISLIGCVVSGRKIWITRE